MAADRHTTPQRINERHDRPDRRVSRRRAEEVMPVRLTHKYAEVIDGVDLVGRQVGDRLPLSPRDARLLIAEGWGEPASREERRRSAELVRTASADRRMHEKG